MKDRTQKIFGWLTLGRIAAVVVMLSLFMGCASVRVVARETNPVEKEIFVEKCGWSSDLEGNKTEVRVSDRGTIGAFTVHYNFFYALGTLISCGHWMPFQITCEVNE